MGAINHRNILDLNVISYAIFRVSRTNEYTVDRKNCAASDLVQLYADLF
jgi:hypothetical protein